VGVKLVFTLRQGQTQGLPLQHPLTRANTRFAPTTPSDEGKHKVCPYLGISIVIRTFAGACRSRWRSRAKRSMVFSISSSVRSNDVATQSAAQAPSDAGLASIEPFVVMAGRA